MIRLTSSSALSEMKSSSLIAMTVWAPVKETGGEWLMLL
jgi:hypothetical protein